MILSCICSIAFVEEWFVAWTIAASNPIPKLLTAIPFFHLFFLHKPLCGLFLVIELLKSAEVLFRILEGLPLEQNHLQNLLEYKQLGILLPSDRKYQVPDVRCRHLLRWSKGESIDCFLFFFYPRNQCFFCQSFSNLSIVSFVFTIMKCIVNMLIFNTGKILSATL